MDYAIRLQSQPDSDTGILMLLDDSDKAESIAAELRRRGQRVIVDPWVRRQPR